MTDDRTRGEAAARALYLVAVRAQLLRRVLAEEWETEELGERTRAHAVQALFDALDDLELAEPGLHAQVAEAHERVIRSWREDEAG